MALSTIGYVASGAGTTAANGNYVPVTGANATYNSVTQYTNGTDFICYGGGSPGPSFTTWGVFTGVNATGSLIYFSSSSLGTNFPLSGWFVSSGAPPPTFAVSLAPQVIVSGATGGGTSIASLNGTYTLSNNLDSQGLQYYVENTGGNYLYYLNSQGSWWLNSTLDQIGSGWYLSGVAGTLPLGSGWTQAGNPAVWGGSGVTLAVAAPAAVPGSISGISIISGVARIAF